MGAESRGYGLRKAHLVARPGADYFYGMMRQDTAESIAAPDPEVQKAARERSIIFAQHILSASPSEQDLIAAKIAEEPDPRFQQTAVDIFSEASKRRTGQNKR